MFNSRLSSRWSSHETPNSTKDTHGQDQIHRLVALGLLNSNDVGRGKKNRTVVRETEINDIETLSHKQKAGLHNFSRKDSSKFSSEREDSLRSDNHSRSSISAHGKQQQSSMLAARTGESRRDRTFIGSQCAACEELLELTLRGERVLQLSCGHVAHEACFYEYIKEFEAEDCPSCNAPLGLDTSRGANIDFANLGKLVKSAQASDFSERVKDQQRPPSAASDYESLRAVPAGRLQSPIRQKRDHLLPAASRSVDPDFEQPGDIRLRSRSADTTVRSTSRNADTQHANGRRQDYDSPCTDKVLSIPRSGTKLNIPAPKITVRSEFPTLSKSQQQQSLTCLVTVEGPDRQVPFFHESLQSPVLPTTIPEEFPQSVETAPKAQAPAATAKAPPTTKIDTEELDAAKDELYQRCDNWHGLDSQRFGDLLLRGTMRVSKDRQAWQDLECYLFTEMLICVKARKPTSKANQLSAQASAQKDASKVTLKGSILIKKHLDHIEQIAGTQTLTLSLSVPGLPHFYLDFQDNPQLIIWRQQLLGITRPETRRSQTPEQPEQESSGTDEDEEESTRSHRADMASSSVHSSHYGKSRSITTAHTEYSSSQIVESDLRQRMPSLSVPLDLVVVIPVSCSMQGLKINVLRDSLRFLISNLGDGDRMGLVTFGSGGGAVPIVGLTTKTWAGWSQALESIRPVGQKNIRADIVEGANVAMDMLMQRKYSNPLSSVFLVSDSATSDNESVDFVVSRAEAAKVVIHSFGLGLSHKPDTLVELSTKTKASYIYVKDWMMLRECVAGCLGALQSTSHQNVRLKVRLPEGCPAKFVKISGALQVTKRASGRDAEISLGDIRFGDKRDILVQLSILPDVASDTAPADPWDNIISGLEALGGTSESDDTRSLQVEEVPMLQADLTWSDLRRNGQITHLPRPSLLALNMLPVPSKKSLHTPPPTPSIPPHPYVVQRRMELLTSDMLSRALTLVSRGQGERAQHLLTETRTILNGLNKGSLPPLPPHPSTLPPLPSAHGSKSPSPGGSPTPDAARPPSSLRNESRNAFNSSSIDPSIVSALDAELESSLEWISHPAVFVRDSRKAVLQAIGVISSQRAYAFRTPTEILWASRVPGVKRLSESSRQWRETGHERLMEE